MTPDQYRTALTTLGLSQLAAGRWLGVSPKTAQNYATKGPSGPAIRAITGRLETVWLIRTCAGLNLDAGEIGAGMLAQIVSEARRIEAGSWGGVNPREK